MIACNFKLNNCDSRNVDIIIFGGVPIIVIIPPKILANAKGINKILGERFRFNDVLIATGNIKARAPTLFIIAEQIATTPLNVEICKV